MTKYEKKFNKLKEVIQIGENAYDIEVRQSTFRPQNINIKDPISQKIGDLTTENMVEFFEYHYEKSNSKSATIQYLFRSLTNQNTNVVSAEQKTAGANWLEQKSGLKITTVDQLINLFTEDDFTDAVEVNDWQRKMQMLVGAIDVNEAIKILSFGKEIGEYNYALHKTVCNSPLECSKNKNYEMKIDFCQSNINRAKQMIAEHEAEEQKEQTQPKSKPLNRIQWNGNQKQLAELFIELKKKGWIEDYEYGAIKAAFTNSDSMHQYLKPSTDTKSGENLYEKVYTTKYSRKFEHIIEK